MFTKFPQSLAVGIEMKLTWKCGCQTNCMFYACLLLCSRRGVLVDCAPCLQAEIGGRESPSWG